jgi:nucleoid DNA-binding protein
MTITEDQLSNALVAAVRDALIEGHRIDVPGLGTFDVRHVPSKVERADDDSSVMIPPRDVVEFKATSE